MTSSNHDKIHGGWATLLSQTDIAQLFYFDYITSTNDFLKWIIRNETGVDSDEWFNGNLGKIRWQGCSDRHQEKVAGRWETNEPVLATASRQTAGRGQRERQWWSPDGVLPLSILTSWERLQLDRTNCSELSLRIASAVLETASDFLPAPDDSLRIKEPNDIYLNDRKLSGILIESPTPKSVIIGIGINLGKITANAPAELTDRIISLGEYTNREIAPASFAAKLIHRIF